MLNRNREAKINVKLLIILILVVIAIGVSLFTARHVRRKILSKMALQAGQAAFENEDWRGAYKSFREYLGRNPNDLEILKKYAKAAMAIRPRDAATVGRAIGVYRRIMQLDPLDEIAHEKLAMLYANLGDYEELTYVARRWIENKPDDLKAQIWLAEALIGLNKMEEAKETLTQFISNVEKLPEKFDEYVRACLMISKTVLALRGNSTEAKKEALEYINRALEYSPESAEVLVSRATFYRINISSYDPAYEDMLTAARKDLRAVDDMGTENPRIRLYLAQEWMAHGELSRAEAEIQAADALPQEVLEEHFFFLDKWAISRYLILSELSLRNGAITEGVALAKEMLTLLKEKGKRILILPNAIRLYVAANDASNARQCLDEYIDIVYSLQRQAEYRRGLAYLKAIVAKVENDYYAVIDILQPVVISDASRPELWGLLAEAFIRTDQTRRAVSALINYLRVHPQDVEVQQQLTREYIKLRDWSNALKTAKLAESLDPSENVLRLLRIEASINVVSEQQEQASVVVTRQALKDEADQLTQLRKANPDNVDIRILQAMIASYLDDPNTAEKELKLAIDECKESLRAEIQLSRFHFRNNNIAEAINICRKACENNSEVAEPWLFLSDLYAAGKDYESARNCLKQAQDTIIDKWEKRSISIKLALLELTHGDRTSGINILTEIAAQDKREVRARVLLLGISEIQGDGAKAQQLIDELRKAEGESGLMWRLYQSVIWLTSDEWRSKRQDIEALLQYCIDSDPGWSSPPILLAEMYGKLQDTRRVENIYRQAIARNSSATDIVDRLVTLLERQGRFSDAEKVLQQSEADSGFSRSRQTLLSIRAGELSRAIEDLKLRVSNDDTDTDSRVLLARLIYRQNQDVNQAFAYLDEAEHITSGSFAATAARVSILRAEGKAEGARQILDDYVADKEDFSAYMLRASYFANEGEFERAEQDYRKLTTFTDQGAIGYELFSNFYSRNQKFDKALEMLEKGLNAYPEDLRLKRRLMKILFMPGPFQDQRRAFEILTELEEQLSQDPELMKFRALQILEESTPQSLEAAKEKLENVIELQPTAVDAQLMLIGIAMQEKDYEAARESAIRAIGSNPDNLPLITARSKAELILGNTQMAAKLAHMVLQKDPNNIEARDVLVAAALNSKNRSLLEEARMLIESAMSSDFDKEKLLISRARVLTAMEMPQSAIPEIEAYYQTNDGSDSIDTIVTLADLYRLSGDMEQADQKLKQAEQIAPNNLAVIHARFVWLVAQNKLEELKGISSAYLSATEQNPNMLVKAATILSSLDSITLKKEGLKLYEQAVKLLPTSKDVRLGLAFSLYQAGNAERAENIYEELLKEYPNDVQILNDLAWILQEHFHRYTDALELANRALRITPNNLFVLDTRGTILSNIPGRVTEAKDDFERLVELSAPDTPQCAKALLQLGRVCVRLSDVDQAKQHLNKAFEIDKKKEVFTPDERSEIAKLLRIDTQTVNN